MRRSLLRGVVVDLNGLRRVVSIGWGLKGRNRWEVFVG